MTDPLGQSQVLPYLFGLAAKGVCIHLVSFEKKEYAHDIPRIKALCEENGVIWRPQKYTKKPPLISTIKDIQRMKKVALRLHNTVNFDIVHCRSYITAIVGQSLQRKKGLKFVFDMRGFWADERVEGKIWDKNKPVFKRAYQYFKRKEIEFFNEADAIVSLTQKGKQEIKSWKNLPNLSKIEVIPCCVDLDHFHYKHIVNDTVNEKRKQLSIAEDDFVLGYVGSI